MLFAVETNFGVHVYLYYCGDLNNNHIILFTVLRILLRLVKEFA